MANLRAGLIGLGAMGRHHARVLREIDGVDLVAVADPSGDKFNVAGDLPVLSSVEEVIAAGVDYVVVCAPTHLHEEIALALADAGVNTLIEKPIAASSDEGERVVAAFASRGLVGAVGHIERYNPALQEMRRRIEAGELGEVYQVVTRRQGPFPGRIADVGVAKDLGVHDFDSTAWIAQSPYKSVSAQTAHRSGREHEDMLLVTGKLNDGVIVHNTVNWLSPLKERLTTVLGEKGTFVADTGTGDLAFYENGSIRIDWDAVSQFRGVTEGNVIRYAFPKKEPLRLEHEAFRDAVLGTGNNIVTLEEGLANVLVAEAALQSAGSGGLSVEL